MSLSPLQASPLPNIDTFEEQRLFDDLCATKRLADQTGEPDDLRAAARAYTAYMRFHLTDPEREVLRLEDIVAALTIENRLLGLRLDQAEFTADSPVDGIG